MKYKAVAGALVAGSIAALLAACGGGGGGDALKVSGTAATGAALSGANVDVRCAQGSGTTTTGADGRYAVAVPSGVAPCMLQVSGTGPDGAPLTLHSAVPPGTARDRTANVTPLTELLLADALASPPTQVFDQIEEAIRRITEESLAASLARMNAALAAASMLQQPVNPISDPLDAAHGNVRGNAHDQLLDDFASRVPTSSLPQLVNQVAVGAANGGSAGILAPALSGGALAGCPAAVSGPYRTLDVWGRTVARDVDFRSMRMRAANGVDWLTLTATPGEACSFVARGTEGGRPVEIATVIGPQGAGAYRTRYTDSDWTGINGYIFPVQSHGLAEIVGDWSFLHSGSMRGEANHYPGTMGFDAAGTMRGCNYDTGTWTCEAGMGPAPKATARADGGFDIIPPEEGEPAVRMYGYRAPSGSLTLFGSQMMGDYGEPEALLTSMVAARLASLPLPAVGSVLKYWNIEFTSDVDFQTSTAPLADAVTVDSVDASAGVVQRHRASDKRGDTLQYNRPLTGTRLRLPAETHAAAIQIPLPGLAMVITANAVPALETGVMFHVLTVERP